MTTSKRMNIKRPLVLACGAALALGAQAMDLAPGGAFVEGAFAQNATYSLTAGLVWPWDWRRETRWGELTGYTEGYVSHWSGRGATGRVSFNQVGLVPMFRFRFEKGQSDWFLEGGIGVSFMDKLYVTTEKQFSTRFNFVDVAGVGRSFGAKRDSDITLRLTHMSNAGIKHPNPGENFLQLRYAKMF